jgi:hypothetical protein
MKCYDVDSIHLAQNRIQRLAFMSTVMKLGVPQIAEYTLNQLSDY